MTPAQMIADLDGALRRVGQSATLERRVPNADAITKAVRVSVRGYDPKVVTDTIAIGSSKVVLSPTSLAGSPFAAEWPRALDKIVISGRRRNIEAAEPIVIDDVLVRINLQVAG